MSKMKRIMMILGILAVSAAWLSAMDADSLWNQAVKDYTEENYQAALDCFSALEAEGYVSRELYYNIGNCYYKLGNSLGQSILYYERALKLDPSYEDAQVNLAIAREYTLDRIDEVPEFILLTWIKAFRDTVSSDAWAWIALALFLVTAVMVLLFRFGGSPALRKTAFALAVAALLMTIISAVFAFNLRSALESDDEAVVTVPVSSVKSSPGSADQSLFILHEGTKVAVMDSLGEWYRIELSDGRQGWMEAEDVEII